MPNRAPFSYFGSKWRLFDNLTAYLPPRDKMDAYLEPFFGSGTLFFNSSQLAISEIINDFNTDIYNFFTVLQSPRLYNKLIHLLHYTPYSKDFFYQARALIRQQKMGTNLQRAWAMYVLYTMSIMRNGINFSRDSIDTGRARQWTNNLERLKYCAQRLQRCTIENEDAITVMKRYDNPRTFIYLDPPYWNVINRAAMKRVYQKNGFSKQQHIELLEWISQAQSMILLSGYHSEIYDSRLQDWHCEEIESYCTTTRGKRGSGKVQKTLEVLWANTALMRHTPRQIKLW